MRRGLGLVAVAAAVAVVVVVAASGASGVSSVGGTITTIAGTGVRGFSGDRGPATSAQLNYPAGVAVDGKRNVYVADRFNLRVRRISADGRITTVAGNGRYGSSGDGGSATSARLYYPVWVAADRVGNVYITDGRDGDLNSRVRKVSPDGTITAFAGTVSSIGGFSGDGGPATSAQLNSPRGLAVDAQGNVYIADTGNNRVRKVTRGGTITTIAGTGKRGFSGDGGPATSARLNWPEGLAVDRQGNVYITDAGTSRLRKVSVDGRITTIAGTGKQGFSGDNGPALSAQLYRPRGLAVDGQGNVYISDAYNHRVRKVRVGPAPAISGRCSKATARQLVDRLGLSLNDPNDPVAKVLCGAFAGPGSQTMVVTLAGPTSTLGWLVFRWTGGTWQLLMRQTLGAVTAAGSDIRQTVWIYRPGDSRCCPSGGTKSRLWRWNGTRFVAGPWSQGTPASSPRAENSGFFKTPSGNIVCQYLVGPSVAFGAVVACAIKSGLKPALPREACNIGSYASDRLILDARGPVGAPPCASDPSALVGERKARVLGYGKSWSGGGIRCTSAVAGLTCRNKSGRGFFLSRESWRRF